MGVEPDIENIRAQVQVTLDELVSEHLIPFRLTAQAISANGPGNYEIPFYASRIHSFTFSWNDESLSFKEVVRTAVLNRVRVRLGLWEGGACPHSGVKQPLRQLRKPAAFEQRALADLTASTITRYEGELELQIHQTNLNGIAD